MSAIMRSLSSSGPSSPPRDLLLAAASPAATTRPPSATQPPVPTFQTSPTQSSPILTIIPPLAGSPPSNCLATSTTASPQAPALPPVPSLALGSPGPGSASQRSGIKNLLQPLFGPKTPPGRQQAQYDDDLPPPVPHRDGGTSPKVSWENDTDEGQDGFFPFVPPPPLPIRSHRSAVVPQLPPASEAPPPETVTPEDERWRKHIQEEKTRKNSPSVRKVKGKPSGHCSPKYKTLSRLSLSPVTHGGSDIRPPSGGRKPTFLGDIDMDKPIALSLPDFNSVVNGTGRAPGISTTPARFNKRISLANVMPKISTLPLEKKPKKFNSNVYPQCFSGKAAVKWMLGAEIGVTNEIEATILGELLLNANVIVPLKRNPNFNISAKDFYAFVEGVVPLKEGTLKRSKQKKPKKRKGKEEDSTMRVFGITLEEVMALQKDSEQTIPIIVTTLTKAIIDNGGHETEGIFRVPGNNQEIARLKAQFNQLDYSITSSDPNDLASVLKLWFRELKEPLIPTALYDEAIKSAVDPAASKMILEKVPDLNKRVVGAMVDFLKAMAAHSEKTKMGIANLAMVFAPGFLRCSDPQKLFLDSCTMGTFVQNLLEP